MSEGRVLEGHLKKLPGGLLVHDPETGEILDVNERFCEMHGYSEAELRELSVEDITSEDWSPPVEPDALVREAAEEGRIEFEWCNTDVDGNDFWVEVVLTPIEHEGEKYVLGSVRDVTERKERERQLQVLDRVLRHNLYNDMNVVRARAELIEEQASDDVAETARDIVEKVDTFVDTADKEREIVKLILERGECRQVDLADRVRRRLERLRRTYPEATIEMGLLPEATAIASNVFGRAVEELVENAIVHHDRTDPTVTVTMREDGDAFEIAVADDGPGIPDQEVDVLTKSREVAPLYHGSGLGLWLVNWIVDLSGGTIDFEENEPRGSVVTIRQPTN